MTQARPRSYQGFAWKMETQPNGQYLSGDAEFWRSRDLTKAVEAITIARRDPLRFRQETE